jgi:hypothetical protein
MYLILADIVMMNTQDHKLFCNNLSVLNQFPPQINDLVIKIL